MDKSLEMRTYVNAGPETLAFCNFVLSLVISDCSDMSDEQFFLRCAVVCGLCAVQ